MKPFGRKPARTSPARLVPANGSGRLQATSRRLTLDLARAETFASMLASSRSSQVIEVSDLLAGMYICNWERLSVYWQEESREEIESFLRGICRISPERWHSWIKDYDTSRRKGERGRLWRSLARFNKTPPSEPALRPSAALATVFKHAEEIAPTRDSVGDGHLPILTSECVLLCIVRSFGSEVSRKLVHAGLDAERLERDVLFPRRAPLS
jgi:hypothetical protein